MSGNPIALLNAQWVIDLLKDEARSGPNGFDLNFEALIQGVRIDRQGICQTAFVGADAFLSPLGFPVIIDLIEDLFFHPGPESPEKNIVGSKDGKLKATPYVELPLIDYALI